MPAGGAEYIVRLHALAPHCPIIVMTAFGDAGLRAEVLRAGASAYFDKPVRVAALKQKVEALLSDARGTRYEDRF
jgi:FixJ family two-component response regulator